MKVNLLKMNFIDETYVYSDSTLSDLSTSKRNHIIRTNSSVPTTAFYITNRVRDKKLKHQKRKIEVEIRNKNYAN
jgi:hypothetical protein